MRKLLNNLNNPLEMAEKKSEGCLPLWFKIIIVVVINNKYIYFIYK